MDDQHIDKKKKADCHRKIADYLQQASTLHLEAAKHCEAEDCGKAAIDTLKALGFMSAAKKGIKKIAKHYAGIPCCHEKCDACGCHK